MSSRSLDDLDPRVRPLVDSFLSACTTAGLDILVTCTLRSNDDQAALYAKGRTVVPIGRRWVVTDAPPGKSAHNHALAIDIVPLVNGKPDWEGADPIWQQIGRLGQAAGLEWAGAPDYPFHELAHFQMPNWREVAGL